MVRCAGPAMRLVCVDVRPDCGKTCVLIRFFFFFASRILSSSVVGTQVSKRSSLIAPKAVPFICPFVWRAPARAAGSLSRSTCILIFSLPWAVPVMAFRSSGLWSHMAIEPPAAFISSDGQRNLRCQRLGVSSAQHRWLASLSDRSIA
jgi:hypothetical protein